MDESAQFGDAAMQAAADVAVGKTITRVVPVTESIIQLHLSDGNVIEVASDGEPLYFLLE